MASLFSKIAKPVVGASFGLGTISYYLSGNSTAARRFNNSPPCNEPFPVLWLLLGPQIVVTAVPIAGYMAGAAVDELRFKCSQNQQNLYNKMKDDYMRERKRKFDEYLRKIKSGGITSPGTGTGTGIPQCINFF